MKCYAEVQTVVLKKLLPLPMYLLLATTLLWALPAQASLITTSYNPAAPTLLQKRFAEKVASPIVPMWQRMRWSLVSPVFYAKRKAKKIALAKPAQKDLVHPRDLRPTLKEGELKKPQLLAEKKNAEELREEKRAKVSNIHQIFGFTTLGLLTATMVIGQINAIDFLSGRLSSQPMIWSHRILSIATTATYLTTLILALFMSSLVEKGEPGDSDSDGGFDSYKWHKALAWVHGIGMLLLVLGGIFNAHFVPSNTLGKTIFTASHLALGYTTLVALGAATVMISFF